MSGREQLAAAMIDDSVGALAGFIASQMVESPVDGGVESRRDFDAWKRHAELRLQELSTALALEEPTLFLEDVLWSRVAFGTRDLPIDTLLESLSATREVLEEKLMPAAAEAAIDYLDRAAQGLRDAGPLADDEVDAGDRKEHRLAPAYLEKVLSGERREAIGLLLGALRGGESVFELYESVLGPTQAEVGRLWHIGELSVAEEHFCTSTTQRSMTVLTYEAMNDSDASGASKGTAVTAATEGNAHDMPLRVLSDFFEIGGWRSVLLGADVPAVELTKGVRAFDADLVLLSATLSIHLPGLKSTIEALREALPDGGFQVMVGGRAFDKVPDLWQKMGADAHAATAREALEVAERLSR